ncbi:MAG: DUF3570 domain-containing protein, partial [Verrucomicrobiota bacterium]
NRPGKRTRLIWRLGLLHHIEALRASIDASYRLFQDDAGTRAHTLAFEWNQKIGEKWVLSPFFRFYHQSQADYYHVTLDGTGIEPNDERTGRSPYFSSDYRVSAFDAYTYGIKLAYFPTDSIGIDLSYERYEMHGQDRVTPGAAYARANVFTIGVNYSF